MDYEPYESSSGTDDDIPPPEHNRMSRGAHICGNEKPSALSSNPYPRMYEETDIEAQIHQLEQEAYISVLRAFRAQDDAITWEKESLITELRKELRLSNEEHRDLLIRVSADETIRLIRDWRQSGGLQQNVHGSNQPVYNEVPSLSISASRKKLNIVPPLPSMSFGGPSPFQPQAMATKNQQSSSSGERGPIPRLKGKKHKSVPPGSSMQHPSRLAGRGQIGNRIGARPEKRPDGSFDPLIGRKVKTRWPNDNNFYEAVITDYNPVKGRHALVYDIGTEYETWEWVNLYEISPSDIKWEGENPGGYVGPNPVIGQPTRKDNAPGPSRVRGLAQGQSRKDLPPPQKGIGKKGLDDIQLLHTETLIKEVEKVFNASHPNPVEMEKAKEVLKEQEHALIDAISRFADLTDGESDESGRSLHDEVVEIVQLSP